MNGDDPGGGGSAQAPRGDLSGTGVIIHAAAEILRVLQEMQRISVPLRASLPGGWILATALRHVDPECQYVVVECSADEQVNVAMLSCSSVTLYCMANGRHIEFAAAAPQPVAHRGAKFIRLRFPHVMAMLQRRAAERHPADLRAFIPVVADADGFMSFDARVIDISPAGIALMDYASDISLEPGTILRGCRLEPAGEPLIVDLEVRYSYPVSAGGETCRRSGCRFLNLSERARAALGLSSAHTGG